MAITEVILTLFLKLFALGFFFFVDLHCPLIRGRYTGSSRKRINDYYSTMSDKILEGIFPHSSQNLSFELF